MKVMKIEGKNKLSGTIKISGAKNSSVALLPASILADTDVTICNVPEITDTDVLCEMLEYLGADVRRASESVVISPSTIVNKEIPKEFTKKLRASYYFMGALLGKYKHVEIFLPGGCSIGSRPIDLHLKGFEALGATITNENEKYIVEAKELKGANIYLDIASVGATINIMLAATLAKGKTIIDNAAKEPEIVNIATYLNNMGAKITGAGTSEIRITGVDKLHGCFHEVIPDRIEAGTYIIIGALLGENLKVYNVIPEHLESVTSKLVEMGGDLQIGSDYIIVNARNNYKKTHIKTMVYPGFPTDLQQPFSILFSRCNGTSIVEETIFENRFMHLKELEKMGMSCKSEGMVATFVGPNNLKGCEVSATDLRAGASLVTAALIADGTTTIRNVEYILRGYEGIVEKLTDVGAKIKIEEIE
ncbi:MAG: UDP-N-acetylglucosamine 1-carboxyvinyltransferase [Bacilli bacterium]|nr:UDP-N-acetylglucosamine 1-carboxyvinyltransferase [Bacilli bacterium]